MYINILIRKRKITGYKLLSKQHQIDFPLWLLCRGPSTAQALESKCIRWSSPPPGSTATGSSKPRREEGRRGLDLSGAQPFCPEKLPRRIWPSSNLLGERANHKGPPCTTLAHHVPAPCLNRRPGS